MNREFWRGKKVFLTGHTGFKGSWLTLWLSDMGAYVYGYALAPATTPSLFVTAKIANRLAASTIADIRDASTLQKAVKKRRSRTLFFTLLLSRWYAAPIRHRLRPTQSMSWARLICWKPCVARPVCAPW